MMPPQLLEVGSERRVIATDVFDEVVVCALAVLCIDGSAVGDLERGVKLLWMPASSSKSVSAAKLMAMREPSSALANASVKELDVADPFLRLVAL